MWSFLKHNYSPAEAGMDPSIFGSALISVITLLFHLLLHILLRHYGGYRGCWNDTVNIAHLFSSCCSILLLFVLPQSHCYGVLLGQSVVLARGHHCSVSH